MCTLKIDGRIPTTYRLDESGILVSTFFHPKLPTEEHIKFENIRNDRFFYVQRNYRYLIVAGICLILLTAFIAAPDKGEQIHVSIAIVDLCGIIISVFLFFFHQPKVYFLKTVSGRFIKFRVRKNEAEIETFIKHVIEKRNHCLKSKYGNPSPHLSYDTQFSNLNALHTDKMITTEEYNEKIEQLNGMFNRTVPEKTFPGYSQN